MLPRAAAAPPAGKWSSNLCAVCDDPTLCCTVCVCSCNAAGQVFERTTGRPNTCLIISIFGWFVFIVSQVASQVSQTVGRTAVTTECAWLFCRDVVDWDQVTVASIVGGIGALVGMAGAVVTTYVICTARRRVRERDRIPQGDCCGGCDDCCVSYWCSLCSLVQLLRHEGIDGGSYRPCTTTAV